MFNDLDHQIERRGPPAPEQIGAQADSDLRSFGQGGSQGRQGQALATEFAERHGIALHRTMQKVHLGRADEARDEQVVGIIIQFQGCSDLFNNAIAQHNDLVGQRHRLDLVMRHIDDRRFQVLMQPGDFDAHMHAEFGIKVRQRYIEQKDLRVADDGATDGDALALAAGQVLGLAVQKRPEFQNAGGFRDLRRHFFLVFAGEFQGESHVFADSHMRVKRVALEHHRNAAVGRVGVIDPGVANEQIATGDVFKPCNHA